MLNDSTQNEKKKSDFFSLDLQTNTRSLIIKYG